MFQSQGTKQPLPVVKPPLIYQPNQREIDEVFDPALKIKPHWEYLLDSVKEMGSHTFEDRRTKAHRILRDDGATYNIYSEPDIGGRTWDLDLIPSLLPSDEWGVIEAGMLERSELFNLLLKDIYGPRTLISSGVMPPEALYCHQGFLRACHGVSLPGEHELILHAVDLIRDDQGSVKVLTDRSQAPSGAGYALENRTVMSRVFPSLFRDSHVHRLSGFFQRLRAKLNTLAPDQDQPLIVVLTPGSHNESYFEHAYIANYLGLHLVQSGDLVVRNGYVWMKSLDGLSRVDVILRRVEDWFCDPVELRSGSQLGVANLLNIARAGRVAIANPLGSGVLENPIFLKYLPAMAKTLLGREPRLSSVETFWCGDEKDFAYVKSAINQLIIKPIYRSLNNNSINGAQLSPEDQKTLIKQIEANPRQWIAQPIISVTTLPTYSMGKLVPRPSILRSFTVASDSSYVVMPGGLSRVGVEEDSFHISNQVGSQSKDTWVIASEPERNVAHNESRDSNIPLRETNLISLPSRVVENLFWLGRYAERTEASLRVLRTTFMLLNGEEPISLTSKRMLLETVTEVTDTQPGFIDASDALIENPEQELLLVIKDGSRMGTVRSNLNALIACADESKEQLSSDTLRVINDIRDVLGDLDTALEGGMASAPEEALDPLVTALMALSGLSQESMVRGMGWRFMDIGRRLERGIQTISVVKTLLIDEVPESDQNTVIQAMLMSLEVLISYRRRNRARLGVQSSLDLVMMDNSNPRSLLYQVERLNEHIEQLPRGGETRHELSAEQRAGLEAETLIKLSLLTELGSRNEGKREKLDLQMRRLKKSLALISNIISDKYFDHREASQQLVTSIWETN